MKKDLVSDMKVYQNARKVSKMLGISISDLKKYSQVIENSGYCFTKEDEKINYLEKDIIVLTKLKDLVNTEGITLDDAAKDIISMFDNSQEEVSIKDMEIDNMEKKLDKAIKFIIEREKIEAEFERIIQEKDELIAKLKVEIEQHKKEKQIINIRDKKLLETIRRRQDENKKEMANNGLWPIGKRR